MVFLTTHTRILVKLHANPIPTMVRQRLCNLLRRSNPVGVIVAVLDASRDLSLDKHAKAGG